MRAQGTATDEEILDAIYRQVYEDALSKSDSVGSQSDAAKRAIETAKEAGFSDEYIQNYLLENGMKWARYN